VVDLKVYRWKIVEDFNSQRDYGKKIAPRIRGVLSLLEKDQILLSREFIEINKDKIMQFVRVKTDKAVQKAVEASFTVGVEIGMIKKLKGPSDGRIPHEEFCKIPDVSYWISQLNPSNIKNLHSKRSAKMGTRSIYSYKLWNFHCWLAGKSFEFSCMIPIEEGKFEQKKQKITLSGVDRLLHLYQEPNSNSRDFIKVIKTYLLDTKQHKDNKVKTVDLDSCAIKSFFRENDSEIDYSFNAKSTYKKKDLDQEEPTMTLEEFFTILTVGRPSITEKAVFLCKFHAGLDSSTLADRFNLYAFDQISRYFKSSDHNSWDLEKCPVPITLVRVKTNFKYTTFLDRDAIEALQKYLDERLKKTGQPMNADESLFLTKHNHPITEYWVERQFNRLATNAGLQRKLKGYKYKNKYASHELRDLLKSTLKVCGTSSDAADHFIGHSPKDTYDKEAKLFPEYLKAEFMKASRKINLFSNFSYNIMSNEDSLREQVESLTKRIALVEEEKEGEIRKKKRVKEIGDGRLWKILEFIELAQKRGNKISMSWDKSKPFYYPEDLDS